MPGPFDFREITAADAAKINRDARELAQNLINHAKGLRTSPLAVLHAVAVVLVDIQRRSPHASPTDARASVREELERSWDHAELGAAGERELSS